VGAIALGGTRAIDAPPWFGAAVVHDNGVSPLLRKRDRKMAQRLFDVVHAVFEKLSHDAVAVNAAIADIR
jgi:hypothetical protein